MFWEEHDKITLMSIQKNKQAKVVQRVLRGKKDQGKTISPGRVDRRIKQQKVLLLFIFPTYGKMNKKISIEENRESLEQTQIYMGIEYMKLMEFVKSMVKDFSLN